MVQQTGLDAAFGAAELGPGKQRQAQRDGGRVQTEQFVFETKLVLAGAQSLLLAEPSSAVKNSSSNRASRTVPLDTTGWNGRALWLSRHAPVAQAAAQAVYIFSRSESARPS